MTYKERNIIFPSVGHERKADEDKEVREKE